VFIVMESTTVLEVEKGVLFPTCRVLPYAVRYASRYPSMASTMHVDLANGQ